MKAATLLLIGLAWSIDALAGPPFSVTYANVPAEARRDFERATAIWETCLVSDVPIRVHVRWIERGPTGFAVPRTVTDLPYLPRQGVRYPSALANALLGERDRDVDDMNIFLSAATNWYFAGETPIDEAQTDFLNVALHV